MKSLSRSLLLSITALAAMAEIAYGAQPPNVVTSDGFGNTAMGGEALGSLTSGTANTASGYWALKNNTQGSSNTASGYAALFSNTLGSSNTAAGTGALAQNTTGNSNTAAGTGALASNKIGEENSAFGVQALYGNTSGSFNSAFGVQALLANTTGFGNTASGGGALAQNTTGNSNTAVGASALSANTTGSNNTASGVSALLFNATGSNNTASGTTALIFNTTGSSNTAAGYGALDSNTEGNGNTASGSRAMHSNTTGTNNVALGHSALYQNATGFRNVALGYQAGYALSGSDNIFIGAGNQGTAVANGVIRIGTKAFQKKAFIAGIQGVQTGSTTASAVFVDLNGQLGTIKSSGRYKEDIQPMGSVSERLFALRPVTFRYKEPDDDGSKPVQFGLIAEEVAEAFPELVVYDEEGKPETVSYHLLATLLLNEFQKEHSLTQAQATRITALEGQSAELAQLQKQVAMMAEVIERLDHERMVATTR